MKVQLDALLAGVKMVLMDIDGTLITGPDDTLENVMRQLRRLKAANIRFTLATGRTLFGAQRVVRQLLSVRMRIPPMIAYNGAVVAWPEESTLVSRFTIPKEIYRELITVSHEYKLRPLIYACRRRLDLEPTETVFGESEGFPPMETDFNGMPISRIDDLLELDSEDVAAVLLCSFSQEVDLATAANSLRGKFGLKLRITSSGGNYIEVASYLATKRHAMEILANRWRISPHQIMAIGDSFNDLEMIEGAGVGVAVANAPAEVKAAADYVCKRDAAEGVVEALRALLAAVRVQRIERQTSVHQG